MTFLETYKQTHQHPVNRLMHTIGIPLIIVSFPVFFFHWKIALGLFISGWVLQFIGHAFEGKMPLFFQNPLYMLVGLVWWFKKILRLVHKNDA